MHSLRATRTPEQGTHVLVRLPGAEQRAALIAAGVADLCCSPAHQPDVLPGCFPEAGKGVDGGRGPGLLWLVQLRAVLLNLGRWLCIALLIQLPLQLPLLAQLAPQPREVCPRPAALALPAPGEFEPPSLRKVQQGGPRHQVSEGMSSAQRVRRDMSSAAYCQRLESTTITGRSKHVGPHMQNHI